MNLQTVLIELFPTNLEACIVYGPWSEILAMGIETENVADSYLKQINQKELNSLNQKIRTKL